MECLLQHRFLGPNPRGFDSVYLGWGPKVCILTSSQMMKVILVWEPHFEDLALRLQLLLHCLQGAKQCALSWRQNIE